MIEPRVIKEIKEFDIVTCNPEYNKPEYKGDKCIKFIPESNFKEFDEFVRKNTPDEESEKNGTLDFFKAYSKKGIGNVIQAKNYVGLVQMKSGFQVEILPKIDLANDDDPEHCTSKIFIDMLKSMKDFPGKSFNTASLHTERMNLYEIFISMYIQQVVKLAKKGLRSSYVNIESNEQFYRGKLLVNENIKKNIAHHELFYVSYDEFHVNTPENRLIKSTLLKLLRISVNSENIKNLRQLLIFFELVEPSLNYEKDFSLVVINRNTKDYEDLINWSKIFLKNKSFSTFSGDTNARALLFPMEKVYESYVARNMVNEYADLDWDISLQDQSYYLFTEEKRNMFSLRPDIVIRTNKHTHILDTKWKMLNNDPSVNYGISQADMYQMFAYSKKYETKYIWVLYPITEQMKNHKPIVFKSGKDTEVRIIFIDVDKIHESLENIKNQILEKEKISE